VCVCVHGMGWIHIWDRHGMALKKYKRLNGIGAT